MQSAFFVACGLLLVGFVLRAKIRLLQVLYIPAAVLGGLLGLAAVALVREIGVESGSPVPGVGDEAWVGFVGWATKDVVATLRGWPGWLISIIFAGLLIERPGKSLVRSLRLALRQGVMVWLIVVGEVTIGLAATWAFFEFGSLEAPGSFGQLIEAGFAGGHGTAAALGHVYKDQGFEAGPDLAFVFATVGLIYGVASGIVIVNIAVRRGWTRASDVKVELLSGLEARHEPTPAAFARVRSEVIDPLVFQALILAVAVVVGMCLSSLLQVVISGITRMTTDDAETITRVSKFASKLPLFMFTLIGGLLVREAMHWLKIDDLIDPDAMRRITGASMEFLIVAAVTSLKVEVLGAFGFEVAIMLLLGFAWTVFCLLFLARRLLPREYWFELGLINYGMSTGTTAQGMMLLRIVDNRMESGAAEDYALGAPLSAPFIGGGVITLILMPALLEQVYIGGVVVVLIVFLVGLYLFGRALARG
ncbi:MAG: hypothetical protein CMJ18_21950 [Phycisphaeraceae bacterium]|nr:hypothetical protein [Phycisphaeraceae bacterium]